MSSFTIAPAREADLEEVRRLFRDYADSLEIELDYQGFEAELTELPGKYASPHGALLIARDGDGVAIGCVALRPLQGPGICEMKRLFVDARGRGQGLGKALVAAILDQAIELGYAEMRLDTLTTMTPAITLYREFGFREIAAYYETPIVNTVFMARSLSR